MSSTQETTNTPIEETNEYKDVERLMQVSRMATELLKEGQSIQSVSAQTNLPFDIVADLHSELFPRLNLPKSAFTKKQLTKLQRKSKRKAQRAARKSRR